MKQKRKNKIQRFIATITLLTMILSPNGGFLVLEMGLNNINKKSIVNENKKNAFFVNIAFNIKVAEATGISPIIDKQKIREIFEDVNTEIITDKELAKIATVDTQNINKNNQLINTNNQNNNGFGDNIGTVNEYRYIDLVNTKPQKKIGFLKKLWASFAGLFNKNLKTGILDGVGDVTNLSQNENINQTSNKKNDFTISSEKVNRYIKGLSRSDWDKLLKEDNGGFLGGIFDSDEEKTLKRVVRQAKLKAYADVSNKYYRSGKNIDEQAIWNDDDFMGYFQDHLDTDLRNLNRHKLVFDNKTTEKVEDYRQKEIERMESDKYLNELTNAFNGDVQKAKNEQKRRIANIKATSFVPLTDKEMTEKTGRSGVGGYSESFSNTFYINIDKYDKVDDILDPSLHELRHSAVGGSDNLPPKTRQVLRDSIKTFEEWQQEKGHYFDTGKMSKEQQKERYNYLTGADGVHFIDEPRAREAQVEEDINRFCGGSGKKATQENVDCLLNIYHTNPEKLKQDTREFLEVIKPEKVLDVLHTIADTKEYAIGSQDELYAENVRPYDPEKDGAIIDPDTGEEVQLAGREKKDDNLFSRVLGRIGTIFSPSNSIAGDGNKSIDSSKLFVDETGNVRTSEGLYLGRLPRSNLTTSTDWLGLGKNENGRRDNYVELGDENQSSGNQGGGSLDWLGLGGKKQNQFDTNQFNLNNTTEGGLPRYLLNNGGNNDEINLGNSQEYNYTTNEDTNAQIRQQIENGLGLNDEPSQLTGEDFRVIDNYIKNNPEAGFVRDENTGEVILGASGNNSFWRGLSQLSSLIPGAEKIVQPLTEVVSALNSGGNDNKGDGNRHGIGFINNIPADVLKDPTLKGQYLYQTEDGDVYFKPQYRNDNTGKVVDFFVSKGKKYYFTGKQIKNKKLVDVKRYNQQSIADSRISQPAFIPTGRDINLSDVELSNIKGKPSLVLYGENGQPMGIAPAYRQGNKNEALVRLSGKLGAGLFGGVGLIPLVLGGNPTELVNDIQTVFGNNQNNGADYSKVYHYPNNDPANYRRVRNLFKQQQRVAQVNGRVIESIPLDRNGNRLSQREIVAQYREKGDKVFNNLDGSVVISDKNGKIRLTVTSNGKVLFPQGQNRKVFENKSDKDSGILAGLFGGDKKSGILETVDGVVNGKVNSKDVNFGMEILETLGITISAPVSLAVVLGGIGYDEWSSKSDVEKEKIARQLKSSVDDVERFFKNSANQIWEIVDQAGNIITSAGETINEALAPNEASKYMEIDSAGHYVSYANPNDSTIYTRDEKGNFVPAKSGGNRMETKPLNDVEKSAREDAWNGSGPSEYFLNGKEKDRKKYLETYQRERQKAQNTQSDLDKFMDSNDDLFGFNTATEEQTGAIVEQQPTTTQEQTRSTTQEQAKPSEQQSTAVVSLTPTGVKQDIEGRNIYLESDKKYIYNEKNNSYEECGGFFSALNPSCHSAKYYEHNTGVVIKEGETETQTIETTQPAETNIPVLADESKVFVQPTVEVRSNTETEAERIFTNGGYADNDSNSDTLAYGNYRDTNSDTNYLTGGDVDANESGSILAGEREEQPTVVAVEEDQGGTVNSGGDSAVDMEQNFSETERETVLNNESNVMQGSGSQQGEGSQNNEENKPVISAWQRFINWSTGNNSSDNETPSFDTGLGEQLMNGQSETTSQESTTVEQPTVVVVEEDSGGTNNQGGDPVKDMEQNFGATESQVAQPVEEQPITTQEQESATVDYSGQSSDVSSSDIFNQFINSEPQSMGEPVDFNTTVTNQSVGQVDNSGSSTEEQLLIPVTQPNIVQGTNPEENGDYTGDNEGGDYDLFTNIDNVATGTTVTNESGDEQTTQQSVDTGDTNNSIVNSETGGVNSEAIEQYGNAGFDQALNESIVEDNKPSAMEAFFDNGVMSGLARGLREVQGQVTNPNFDGEDALRVVGEDILQTALPEVARQTFGEIGPDGERHLTPTQAFLTQGAAGIVGGALMGDTEHLVETATGAATNVVINNLAENDLITPETARNLQGYMGDAISHGVSTAVATGDVEKGLRTFASESLTGYVQGEIENNQDLWGGDQTQNGLPSVTTTGLQAGAASAIGQLINGGRLDVGQLAEDTGRAVGTRYVANEIANTWVANSSTALHAISEASSQAMSTTLSNVPAGVSAETAFRAADMAGTQAGNQMGSQLASGMAQKVVAVAPYVYNIGKELIDTGSVSKYTLAQNLVGGAVSYANPALGTAFYYLLEIPFAQAKKVPGWKRQAWAQSAQDAINPQVVFNGMSSSDMEKVFRDVSAGNLDKAKNEVGQAVDKTILGDLANQYVDLSPVADNAKAIARNNITRMGNYQPGELEADTSDYTGDNMVDKYIHLKNKLKDCYNREDQDCVRDASRELTDAREGVVEGAKIRFEDKIHNFNEGIWMAENTTVSADTQRQINQLERKKQEQEIKLNQERRKNMLAFSEGLANTNEALWLARRRTVNDAGVQRRVANFENAKSSMEVGMRQFENIVHSCPVGQTFNNEMGVCQVGRGRGSAVNFGRSAGHGTIEKINGRDVAKRMSITTDESCNAIGGNMMNGECKVDIIETAEYGEDGMVTEESTITVGSTFMVENKPTVEFQEIDRGISVHRGADLSTTNQYEEMSITTDESCKVIGGRMVNGKCKVDVVETIESGEDDFQVEKTITVNHARIVSGNPTVEYRDTDSSMIVDLHNDSDDDWDDGGDGDGDGDGD